MRIKDLKLEKLPRVSPSRYKEIQSCLLREVWNASGNEPLLPTSPAAELGRVIHQLFEEAGRGQLGMGEEETVDTAWIRLIIEAEEKMSKSWVRRQQVPLSQNIPDYEVRRLRACGRAMELARESALTPRAPILSGLEYCGFELWVETDDGAVGGYIDRVKRTENGIVISDYKSGAIMENSNGEGLRIVKEAYRYQMELYAALYKCRFGEWPIGLEILPLQGVAVRLSYSTENAERLLEKARGSLHDANATIAEIRNGTSEQTSLASPNAENCRICLYRPACLAYWTARERDSAHSWPHDIRGVLREKIILRNGRFCIRIARNNTTTDTVSIRNISSSPERHLALQHALKGSQLTVYGLKYLYRSHDYKETQNTVIYQTD